MNKMETDWEAKERYVDSPHPSCTQADILQTKERRQARPLSGLSYPSPQPFLAYPSHPSSTRHPSLLILFGARYSSFSILQLRPKEDTLGTAIYTAFDIFHAGVPPSSHAHQKTRFWTLYAYLFHR